MGMGEPLLNLPTVIEAIRDAPPPEGLRARRRASVTVSTAGVVPKIAALLAIVPINLAVSLHAATDAVRDVLVPINKRFPLDVLMARCAGSRPSPAPSGLLRVHADGRRERRAG